MIQLPLFCRGFRIYAYRLALQDRQLYLLQLDHLLPAQSQERAWSVYVPPLTVTYTNDQDHSSSST
jgi:hypothetical protein